MIFELTRDFAAVTSAMPKGHNRHRMLTLLEEAIRRDVHFIDRHPTTLFQCMWNSCWWYDSPAAAQHYQQVANLEQAISRSDQSWLLHELLDHWLDDKKRSERQRPWLRSHRPPPTPLGTALNAVLRGHDAEVRQVFFTIDGSLIAGRSKNGVARIWNAETGEELCSFDAHSIYAMSVEGRADTLLTVTRSRYNPVCLWNAVTGEFVKCEYKDRPAASIQAAVFVPGEQAVIVALADWTIRSWDTFTGRLLWRTKGTGIANCLACSPTGTWIVSASSETIELRDATTGVLLRDILSLTDQLQTALLST